MASILRWSLSEVVLYATEIGRDCPQAKINIVTIILDGVVKVASVVDVRLASVFSAVTSTWYVQFPTRSSIGISIDSLSWVKFSMLIIPQFSAYRFTSYLFGINDFSGGVNNRVTEASFNNLKLISGGNISAMCF